MVDPSDQTRDLPPLVMRGAFAPATVNTESRTVDLVWTTGARVKRGFWDPYWEELSLDPKHVRMDRLNNGAPLLAAHNGYELGGVLGVVESARLEKGKGIASVRFAKAEDNPEADKAFRMVQDGILQNISVGYRVYKLEQTEDARARDDKTPVLLATDWEPYELSVVPMGADDGAGFRSSSALAPNPCIFVTRKEEDMADPTTSAAPAPTTTLPGASAVEEATRAAAESRAQEAATRAAAESRATEAALRAERERVVEIRALVRQTSLGDELADKLIKDGARIDDVRKSVLDHLASQDGKTPISSLQRFSAGEDQHDKFVHGACAAIIFRAGHTKTLEQAKTLEHSKDHLRDLDLDGGEYRKMTLVDLARAALEMRGQSTRGLDSASIVKRALSFRGDQGFNTTSDFAVLLETAVNKVFLGMYAVTPTTWRRWCGVKSVQDFRTATFYRPGSFGKLDKVTEAGEIKHKNIPDGEKATITPATIGNIVGLTRKAIVNDDLGAFRDLAAGLGQAAAYTVEADAFALVTANSGLGPTQSDAQPLFHANRSNIGPTGIMSVATWDGASAAMAAQKDPSKNMILDLAPAVLLCPRTLGLTATQLQKSPSDPTVNKNSNVPNPVANMVRDIVATAQLAGTRHYFLADPGLYPVFAVGFIDGQEAPQIESEQSFEYDGLQIRVRLDYGTAVLDYRGGVTCAGA